MTRIQHLEARIDALEEMLRQLTGRPRGPITYMEAEQAMRNGDGGRMLEKYVEQYENPVILPAEKEKRRVAV